MKPETFKYMSKLGIPANLKAYRYISCFIEEFATSVSEWKFTALYSEIGKHFNTTGSRVERSLRHAIQNCWRNVEAGALRDQLSFATTYSKTGCPTVSEYLAAIAADYCTDN